MHHNDAVGAVFWIRKFGAARPRTINFVSPAISSLLAATHLQGDDVINSVDFRGDAKGYANSNGLTDTLREIARPLQRSGRQGMTYSQLTRLSSPSDVNFCNSVINDVIFSQLHEFNQGVVQQLAKVVGELHDNIVSHAKGAGFSAIQVYEKRGETSIEFAIADAGCGMLGNIRRSGVAPDVDSHGDAIQWCLARGNTTARSSPDDWAQWIPEDFIGQSPYPNTVKTRSSEDNHMGEGMWLLSELIRTAKGQLWILSGDTEYNYGTGNERLTKSKIEWSGVAIEFEFPIPRSDSELDIQKESFDQLAEELGL